MSEFPLHTIATAPAEAKPILEGANGALGFVPHLYAKMAEAPAVLNAYRTIAGLFEKSSLSPVEQQVVLLVTSVENNCEFCVAAHSVIAKHMVKAPAAVVDAIRDEGVLPDTHLQALATFTRAVVKERGWVSDATTQALLNEGFSKQQALEIILGVSVKTLSNYVNHLVKTPVNEQFASEAWKKR